MYRAEMRVLEPTAHSIHAEFQICNFRVKRSPRGFNQVAADNALGQSTVLQSHKGI